MTRLSVYVVLFYICSVNSARVHIGLGDLEGGSYFTKSGKEIFTFVGVPYAKPRVGDSRFKEPKPANNWTGVWQATDYSPPCVQFFPGYPMNEQIIGSEDCLYLNIYTPSVSESSNLPVLVYFHGGAFMFGESAPYKPNFLHENHDLVFVSVSYRLGPFGFLSTEDDVVPGNNGLKDQVLALKWVQDNIAAFGGDKTKVTIAGNSAGGTSVHLHFLSPLSRGLFDKGISSSGSALTPWSLAEEPLQKAQMLAGSLGCPVSDSELMVKCLKQRSSSQILSKIKPLFMPWMLNPFSPFGPVVEKSSRQTFLAEYPYQMLKNGDVYDRPWFTSVTTEEGLYPAAYFIDRDDLLESLNDNWVSIAPHLLDYNYTVSPNSRNLLSEKVRKFYFGSDKISSATRDKVIQMVGDRLFNADINLAVRLHASVTTSPVFFFTFGYRGSVSLSDRMIKSKGNYGVSHFDDIFYIFALARSAPLQANPEDRSMIVALTDVWGKFIKTGNPTPPNIQWEPISPDSRETGSLTHLFIKSHSEMTLNQTDNFGNYHFWHSLGLKENIEYIDVKVRDEL